MLEAPLCLLVRAALPLIPLDAPPNALLFVALGVFGTCRLPTRSPPAPPLAPRFAPMLLAPPPAGRVDAFAPPPAGRVDAFAPPPPGRVEAFAPPPPGRVEAFPPPPPRFIEAGCCRAWFCRAFACRVAAESPRAVPPYWVAVARFEYGVPPRCCGLCCQLLPPPAGKVLGRLILPVLMFPRLIFVLL